MTTSSLLSKPTGLALVLSTGLLAGACAGKPTPTSAPVTPTKAATPVVAPILPATESKPLPDGRKMASFEGVTFEYDPALFGDAKGEFVAATPLQSADEKPDGVYPRHRRFSFGPAVKGKDAGHDPYLIPYVAVFPIEEFKKAYAVVPDMAKGLTEEIAKIRTISEGTGPISLDKDFPYGVFFDASQAFRAHATRVPFKSGKGFGFLTQFNIEPTLINNENMSYVLQGVTADGKYYILAEFYVTSPLAAPKMDGTTHDGYAITNEKGYPAYVAKTAKKLDNSPARDFTPNLEKLDELFKSITVAN